MRADVVRVARGAATTGAGCSRCSTAARVGSVQFFSTAAGQWDDLRAELFGATSDLRILPALLPPTSVVGDLGCGSGRIAAALAPFVSSVIAVDASPEMLSVARERLAGFANVHLHEGSLESLPIESGTLDLALVVHVLHHVPEPALALAEAARVLKPGGRLVVADVLPHARHEYRRTMGHIWLGFDRAAIEEAFADAGLDRRPLARARYRGGREGPRALRGHRHPTRRSHKEEPPDGSRRQDAPVRAGRAGRPRRRSRSPTCRSPSSAATRSASPSRRCPA